MTFGPTRSPTTNWINGTTVLGSEAGDLENKNRQAINGTKGSAHAPAALHDWLGTGEVTGPFVVFGTGALLKTELGGRFVLGDGDYPVLPAGHPRQSRILVTSGMGWVAAKRYHLVARPDLGGQQFLAQAFASDGQDFPTQPLQSTLALVLHHNSTLTQLVLAFRVGWPHDDLPPSLLRARIVREDGDGNRSPMTSTSAGADANGWVTVPTPDSGEAWYANGAQQTLTIPVDTINAIDTANFDYLLEVEEEVGLAGWPWQLRVKAACTQSTRGENITPGSGSGLLYVGVVPTGTRVLVKDQTVSSENGIMVVYSAGVWQRASDLASPGQFERGMIVPGPHDSLWQYQGATPPGLYGDVPWSGTTAFIVGQVVRPTTPNGYVYRCTTAGTSGGGEPAWPTTIGAPVSDSSVTWVCQAVADSIVFAGPTDDTTATDGSLIPRGSILGDVEATFANITDLHFQ